MRSDEVAVVNAERAEYPRDPPYPPSETYPEYAFPDSVATADNVAYAAVRRVLAAAGLDVEHYGQPSWNPLGELMSPGEKVVLKPNMVKQDHPRDPEGWAYVLTHGSVVRAVADYIFKAVGPTGLVTIADAPQTDSSFPAVAQRLALPALVDFYGQRGLSLRVLDLRREEWTSIGGVVAHREQLPGDPAGAVAFDLGDRSEFVGHPGAGRYYGADYDMEVVNYHHTGGRHEYLLARSVLEADVIVNLPKLKTHKKAGVTLAMKNLVGLNADKNWLPHHTEGPPSVGGDERPQADLRQRIERRAASATRHLLVRAPRLGGPLVRVMRRGGTRVFGDTEEVVRSGNWWGNDTVWRMCLDLNKLARYGRSDGTLADVPVRRHLVLVDGIVAGQGRGPMNPDPLPAGVVLFGTNEANVDAAATVMLGFDPEKVPMIRNSFRIRHLPLVANAWRDIALLGQFEGRRLGELRAADTLRAQPHFAWAGRIELSE